ncbi:hypothetical protein FDP41_013115 [Naegleria fowleri]|uniref:Exonuclease domain-containing protein n=1 Tax=Naegleria fowleri TaxID=5763 RepID=A0A6A5C1I4_NAEFO|nr:uncharacterized protein FDP41_013115 [Naegleria fowleri]KAF0980632.1 hypothetical protein FDP41_013115 [Naegleria fowleri]CAG4719456.1 unnamed protein product [Naegleria fowleri]
MYFQNQSPTRNGNYYGKKYNNSPSRSNQGGSYGSYYSQQASYPYMMSYQQGYSTNPYSGRTTTSSSGMDWIQLSSVETSEDNRVVVADNYDECIWTGSSNGRITGYHYPSMDKYCSFRAFEPNYDIKQMIVQKERIYSLSSNGFSVHSRGGLYRYSFEDSEFFGDQLLTFTFHSDYTPGGHSQGSRSQYSLIMGGNFTKLFNFDLNAQKIISQVETNQGICIMKTGGRYVCCGGTLGELSLRDPRSLKSEHSFEVHTGTISDIAIKDNVLVTCGFNNRYGELTVDNMVKAFDLRTLRMLGQVHFPLDPTFLGFHPRVSSMLLIVSQTGCFQFKDLQAAFNHQYQNSDSQLYQISLDQNDNNPSCIQSFDISSTGNIITFGDQNGLLHFWSSQSALDTYNQEEYKPLNAHRLVDEEAMPNDGTTLLSDWPNYSYLVGQHPLEIHPQILENLEYKKSAPPAKITYGVSINPGLKRVIDGYLERKTFRDFIVTEESGGKKKKKTSRVLKVIPKEFSLNVVKNNNRLRFQEFDFSKYNDTKFVGLENGLEIASILNSYIQVLYHLVPQLRICIMNFLSEKPNCISSELGFLFSMMEQAEKAEKKAVEATNFYRLIQTLDLSFLCEKSNKQKLSPVDAIQKFNSFILKQLQKEMSSVTFTYSMTYPYIFASPNYNLKGPNSKKQVIATNNSNIQLLKKQNKRRQRTMIDILFGAEVQSHKYIDTSFDNKLKSINLQYPYDTFEDMLKDYLNNPTNNLLTLPNIFNFTVPTREEDIRWIKSQHNNNELTNTAIPLHFTIIQTSDKSQWEPFIFNDEKQKQQQELYHNIQPSEYYLKQKRRPPMSITYNLTAVIIQVRHPFQEKTVNTKTQTSTTKTTDDDGKDVYDTIENACENGELSDEDENEEENDSLSKNFDGHCVALIKVANEWVLFNDFSISAQKEKDVTIYSQTWKTPALLFYVRQDIQNVLPTVLYSNPINSNLELFNSSEFKSVVNFNGDIVSIDAEFVLTKKEHQIDDGQRFALGRVSIISMDEEIIFDDYIATSEKYIEDYMTRFSGLKPGDLDIDNTSNSHHVTELKYTYLKLRYLMDVKKVKFIGHGLSNDFKIINIFVPKEQIIDTVELFRLPNQRKISLRFLCKYLLHQDIQQDTHDSVEDARTALRLYKKYTELKQKNSFTSTLQDIYNIGRQTNWQ